jgi:hypothetical protein
VASVIVSIVSRDECDSADMVAGVERGQAMTPRKMTTDVGVDEITLEDYFAAAALTGTLAAQTRKVPIDVVGRYAVEIGEWMAAESRRARAAKSKPRRAKPIPVPTAPRHQP